MKPQQHRRRNAIDDDLRAAERRVEQTWYATEEEAQRAYRVVCAELTGDDIADQRRDDD